MLSSLLQISSAKNGRYNLSINYDKYVGEKLANFRKYVRQFKNF